MSKTIKLFDPVYIEALKIASEIHDKSRTQINLKNKDKKLAIYYLQGGCITHAYLAIHHWQFGDLGAPFICKRIMQEMGNVALFVSVLPEGHRYIESFLGKSIISFPDIFSSKWEKERDAIMKKMKWDEQVLRKFVENDKLLNSGFSNAVHPSLETAAFNSDKETGEYDYDLTKGWTRGDFIRNFDFGHYIILPAINPLIVNCEILKIKKGDYSNLSKIWDQVSAVGKDIFDNLKDSTLNS